MIEIEIVNISSISKVIRLLHRTNEGLHHNVNRRAKLNDLNYLIMNTSHNLEGYSWPIFG